MEGASGSMAAILLDDGATLGFGKLLDGVTDVAQRAAGTRRIDAYL